MKLLYLNPSGQLGGAERGLLNLLETLRATEPAWPLCLISGEDGPLVTEARSMGVVATVVPFPPRFARLGDAGAGGPAGSSVNRMFLFARSAAGSISLARYVPALRRAMKRFGPHIIHTNGMKMHVLGALVRPAGVALVWHMHDYPSLRPVMARLLPFASRRCSSIIANSISVENDVCATCGDGVRTQTIYNPIDLTQFSPAGTKLDLDRLAGMPLPAGPVVRIGLIATMARWKGHELFISALGRIPEDFPLRAYIIGDSLYQTDGSQHTIAGLRRIVEQAGLAHRIGFTGFIRDVPSAMRALDIVVHTSVMPEPFGRVIAEGMACGRPVVVSEAGGAAEILALGPGALGFNPGDPEALARHILTLAKDQELRQSLGSVGRRTAENFFGSSKHAQAVISVYHSAVAGKSATPQSLGVRYET